MTGTQVSRTKSPTVWLDVTGIVRWGAQPPTGIQRVETVICKHGMEIGTVGFVAFDGVIGKYRRLSRMDRAFLDFIIKGKWATETGGYWARLRSAFAFLPVQFNYQDNETSRRLAHAVTGFRGRSGPAYVFAKTVIRLIQWSYLLGRFFVLGARRLLAALGIGVASTTFDDGGVLLVSHEVNNHGSISTALSASGLAGVNIVHDLIPVLMPQLTSSRFTRRMDSFFRRILDEPEPIIAVSEATRDDLLSWNRDVVGAAYPYRVKVCPLGSALVSTEGDNDPIPGLSGRRFAVFCSTFDIRKNQHLLVAAWAWLARNIPVEKLPDLVLIGRRGNATPLVEAELEKAPELAGRVHILSGISDRQLRWAYRNAHLGLFPSSAEGWGLGVSECMANGLPVVHADVPALKEAAQKLMPVLPAGDFDAWAATLKDLFEHPEKIDALRDLVAERYDHGTPEGFAGCVISYLQALADTGLEAARKDGGQA
ncbi:glycosyltransferase [Nitratireductor pacificus]|uniref:Group 1 glycosyl transferase n=1 Tax=Nitratireductor pacificus pht-3B TaxID=391937 RepID=K2LJX0_9HYPH|nr:glycosyltransferase [Nitratireductor pacificus]EKF18039.1 group 1 glycosyl transferase [Nitratireductor pacificus pht-3B]